MASQGPNTPGGALDDPSTGSNGWGATEGNIAADDGTTADCTIDPAGSSNYLEGYSYGFAIPSTAQVVGITVEVKSSDPDGVITDDLVSLRSSSSAPGPTGNNYGNASAIPTALGYTSYGGDTWGLTWTPSDINDGNFGVVLQFGNASGASHTVSVDHIRVTVAYRIITFTTQPSNTAVGATITPAVVVTADPTSLTGDIAVAIGTNPAGGTLSGTLTQTMVSGVATFNNLSINSPGTGYTLTATLVSTSLPVITSSSFNITGTGDVLHPQACL